MDIPIAIVLVILGAVLSFALNGEPSGLDLDSLGWILMITGVVIAVLSVTGVTMRGRRRVVEVVEEPPPMTPAPSTHTTVEFGSPSRVAETVEQQTFTRITRITEHENPTQIERKSPAQLETIIEHEPYDDPKPRM